MVAETGSSDEPGQHLLDELLEVAHKQYVEKHEEEPPDEFFENVRERILLGLAKKGREEHRDVYDALAEE